MRKREREAYLPKDIASNTLLEVWHLLLQILKLDLRDFLSNFISITHIICLAVIVVSVPSIRVLFGILILIGFFEESEEFFVSSFVEVRFPGRDDAEWKTEQESHDVTVELGVGLAVEDKFEGENDNFDQTVCEPESSQF